MRQLLGEHTPGPWKVVGTEIWGANVKIASGRGAYDEKDRQKNKANARLIAAAPDLLEICNKIYYNGEPIGKTIIVSSQHEAMLEAAIAKAEEAP